LLRLFGDSLANVCIATSYALRKTIPTGPKIRLFSEQGRPTRCIFGSPSSHRIRRKLLDLLDELNKKSDDWKVDKEKLRARLEVMLNKMLDEEEDLEHARREAFPDAAEKAARGKVRAAARAESRPRPLTAAEWRDAVDQAIAEILWT
jgi:hypothetical protein